MGDLCGLQSAGPEPAGSGSLAPVWLQSDSLVGGNVRVFWMAVFMCGT